MEDLKDKATSLNQEVGYLQKPNSTNTGSDFDYNDNADPNTNELIWTIPAGTDVRGLYHTHYNIETQLPVFSPDDLYTLFELFGPVFDASGNLTFTNNIHQSITYILVTAHGTKLALKFDTASSIEDFREFGEQYFGDWNTNFAPVPGVEFESDRDKFMAKYNEYVKDKFSIEKQKKKFAKFLDKNDLGLSLYQANDDFSQWKKINKSGDPTPCN